MVTVHLSRSAKLKSLSMSASSDFTSTFCPFNPRNAGPSSSPSCSAPDGRVGRLHHAMKYQRTTQLEPKYALRLQPSAPVARQGGVTMLLTSGRGKTRERGGERGCAREIFNARAKEYNIDGIPECSSCERTRAARPAGASSCSFQRVPRNSAVQVQMNQRELTWKSEIEFEAGFDGSREQGAGRAR